MNTIRRHTTQALKRFSDKEITRVSLSQLYSLGRYMLKIKDRTDYKVFEIQTKFLYKELPIRLSQCIKGFYMGISPYSLHKIPTFQQILKSYANDFEKLVELPEPNTEENDAKFMTALREMNQWHQSNLVLINQGLRELSTAIQNNDPTVVPNYLLPNGKPQLEEASSPAIDETGQIKWLTNQEFTKPTEPESINQAIFWNNNPNLQYAQNRTYKFFEWFYSMCLGTQLLIEGQIYTRDNNKGYVRKIHPIDIARAAANDARTVAAKHYGIEPPQVEIITADQDLFTVYIPHFLHSILFELMKNSFRATMDFYKDKDADFPPIKLVIAKGLEDLTFKVSDQGGGMPHSQVENLWSFIHQQSVNEEPENLAYPSHPLENHQNQDSAFDSDSDSFESSSINSDMPLYGYGVGLPTARMIARYFGGDLDVVSMEGYGSDFYLHLHRSGNVLECTPDIKDMTIMSASSSVSDLVDSLNKLESS